MSRNTKQHIVRYSNGVRDTNSDWFCFFPPECNKYKHLSPLESELISQCLHHIIPFINIHSQNGNNGIVQDSSSNIVSLNDPKTLTHFHVHTPTLSLLRQRVANTHRARHRHRWMQSETQTHTQMHIHTRSEKISSWCLLDRLTGLNNKPRYAYYHHPLVVVCEWVCESSKKYNGGNLISVHSAQQMITVHVVSCSCWQTLCVWMSICLNIYLCIWV